MTYRIAYALSIGAKINDVGSMTFKGHSRVQKTCVFRSPPRKFAFTGYIVGTLEIRLTSLYSNMESLVGFPLIPKYATLNGLKFCFIPVKLFAWLSKKLSETNTDRPILSAANIDLHIQLRDFSLLEGLCIYRGMCRKIAGVGPNWKSSEISSAFPCI